MKIIFELVLAEVLEARPERLGWIVVRRSSSAAKSRPYWWIRSMPTRDVKNYFSTGEYFLSTTESAPLLYVTG